jgi:hypothetical protein
MTYEEFLDFVPSKCMYETIYEDSGGYPTLVIRMLDAYSMVNKAQKKEWVGLTKEEARKICVATVPYVVDMAAAIEAKLKEKNT